MLSFGREAERGFKSQVPLIPILFALIARAVFAQSNMPQPKPSTEGWKPVQYSVAIPSAGVTLDGGVFKSTFENNKAFLLNSFPVHRVLLPFELRAGHENIPADLIPLPAGFWTSYPGTDAGRFLMGAGNLLRWEQSDELRRRMDEVVDGIDACKQPDGYLMAYPEDRLLYGENANYVRVWVTHGLLAAGAAGNPKAYGLIRGFEDWFNQCKYLPGVRNAELGYQGMVANANVYSSPISKPKDIEVLQQYYQEDWLLDELIARDKKAIWDRPQGTPRTHCNMLWAIEAYLDMYRATGLRRYLDAVLGAWDLYRDNWIHLGGSLAISERWAYPPKSYYLDKDTGELCCSVSWIYLNERVHQLFPAEEKYVSEIERSIYNVALANQDGATGIRYHAVLDHQKEKGTATNTCCEGNGARIYGDLPEFIYSLAADGLYVNLYGSSTITWRQSHETVSAKEVIDFPYDKDVRVSFNMTRPVGFKLHIRIPSWAVAPVQVSVNNKVQGTGQPGSYLVVDRTWAKGDTVSFILPLDVRITQYEGDTRPRGLRARYGVEYGPLLMAFVGPSDYAYTRCLGFRHDPKAIKTWLVATPDQPLHFSVEGNPQYKCVPYFEVATGQDFSCFPIIETIDRYTYSYPKLVGGTPLVGDAPRVGETPIVPHSMWPRD